MISKLKQTQCQLPFQTMIKNFVSSQAITLYGGPTNRTENKTTGSTQCYIYSNTIYISTVLTLSFTVSIYGETLHGGTTQSSK
ncbi:hypothetical protein K501DRAFT_32874 [Backusella circina FSU 941]|nr:hypothetical protein K501DRAFT_32874 [Backusella circina FSU 941]